MPFIDLNNIELLDKETYDVIIIGAGAAGILLSVKLSNSGKKILLVESGHFFIDEEKQKLNEVINTGKTLENAVWGRKRAIGGTTLAWGGQSLPFAPLDFSKREWVENSGWPVTYEEIKEFYDEANAFMGIDLLNYHDDIFKRIKLKNPGVDEDIFDYHVSKWADEPNFQTLYKKVLEEKVTVIYNAHLYKINRSATGYVDNIDVYNFKKRLFNFKTNTLIIASGGIESVRILLNNNLGDQAGWLGKCFMDHPCLELGEIFTGDPYRLQKYFNTHIWQKHKYSIRLSLPADLQEEKKLLNCSASIQFMPAEDMFDPYAEILSLRKAFNFRRFLKLSTSIKSIFKSTAAYLKDKFYYKVNAVNKILVMVEQEPLTESCIMLDKERDQFDMPKASIHWEISYKTWQTVVETSTLLKKEIERLDFGRVAIHPHVNPENNDWERYLSDVNHHMGGTRMSSVASGGVVDKNLQVWGVPNLYVCSSSVFPTSSHSNPTLTLLALGVRLSNYLIKEKQL